MRARQLITVLRQRRPVAAPPSAITPTGDQAASNVVALGSSGTMPQPYFGGGYAAFRSVADFVAVQSYLDSNSTDGMPENRLWSHGPHQMPENGTLSHMEVALRRGAFAQAARAILYQDSGLATETMNNPVSGAPSARIGANAGAEVVVPAAASIAGTADAGTDVITAAAHGLVEGQIVYVDTAAAGLTVGRYFVRNPTTNTFQLSAEDGGSIFNLTSSVAVTVINRADGWVTYPLPAESIAANLFVWPTLYVGDVPSGAGAQALMTIGGQASDRVRSNAAAPAYSSSGAPSATWPAVNRSTRRSWAMRVYYTPVAPVAPVITAATANLDRSITVTGTLADSRHPLFVVVQARPAAGAWAVIAVVPVVAGAWTAYHRDLVNGTAYEFKATARYKNTDSAESNTLSATAGGVRVAFVRATPALLSQSAIDADPGLVQNPWRGVHGSENPLHDIGVPLYHIYNRTALLWRSIEPTLGNYTIAPINTLLDALDDDQIFHGRIRTTVPNSTASLPADISSAYYTDVTADGGMRYPNYDDSYILNADGESGRIQMCLAAISQLPTSLGVPLYLDPRYGLGDMGWVNRWGEYTDQTVGRPPCSVASKKLVIDAVTGYFPNTLWIMSLDDDEEVLWYALQKPNVIGVRQDALGDLDSPYMEAQLYGDRSPRLRRILSDPMTYRICEHKTVWEFAADMPHHKLAEHDVPAVQINGIHNINFGISGQPFSAWPSSNQVSVRRQVARAGYIHQVEDAILPSPVANGNTVPITLRLRNRGNGPLPRSVYPELQLRDAGGAVVWSHTLSVDLATLRPDVVAADYHDLITVNGVAPGFEAYRWAVQVPGSTAERRPPLRLGNANMQAGVWYELASGVTVI